MPARTALDALAHHEQRIDTLFKLIAVRARRSVLRFLGEGEADVAAVCIRLGYSQPATSYHLALLRMAKLVTARKAGRQRLYTLTPFGARLVELIDMPED